MEIRHKVEAKVQMNYHVVLGQDWHFYSVPYQYVGKPTQIAYTHSTVEIYCEHERIAVHQRNTRKNGYTTLKEHMPEGHRYYLETKGWDAEYFRKKAGQMTPEVAQVIERVLGARFFYEQTYNACIGILRLADKYSIARLTAACGMALKANVTTYRFISTVLKNNRDKQNDHFTGSVPVLLPEHENLRGPNAYQ